MSCNTWNNSNLKKFITEFKKIDGADIAIEKLETNRLEATYHKGVIDLPIVITQGSTSKYLVSFPSLDVKDCATDYLREVEQAVEVILCTYLSTGTAIEAQAKIKSHHWNKRLTTIERADGYRTNLYVSRLLAELIKLNYIHIDGLVIKVEEKGIRCKYSKNVLDYSKIQRESAWDQYDQGFVSVKELRESDSAQVLGYMHPSMTWQIGRLF